ncbi:hypothetical protein ANN_26004 [Periplaneta americana]|uniref:Mariner Mos1 transposase n=1 Tax=Periplaneta americana TaxID=6978 RepID=A0ABQ8S4Y2_PERAM|nr:hypothetical protein ANN_26004 [Periplaneta americana]
MWHEVVVHKNTFRDCVKYHHLRLVPRRKRRHLVVQNPIILHDNARSPTAAAVKDLLRRWQWKILEHPPYSPDMSQYDYDLSAKVKEQLRKVINKGGDYIEGTFTALGIALYRPSFLRSVELPRAATKAKGHKHRVRHTRRCCYVRRAANTNHRKQDYKAAAMSRMCEFEGESFISERLAQRWLQRFYNGEGDIEALQIPERPKNPFLERIRKRRVTSRRRLAQSCFRCGHHAFRLAHQGPTMGCIMCKPRIRYQKERNLVASTSLGPKLHAEHIDLPAWVAVPHLPMFGKSSSGCRRGRKEVHPAAHLVLLFVY